MKILITGNEKNFQEWSAVLSGIHDINYQRERPTALEQLRDEDLVIDFHDATETSSTIEIYNKLAVPVFLNTVFGTLAAVRKANQITRPGIYGFNGLTGFFNGCIEAVIPGEEQPASLQRAGKDLGIDVVTVKDQVGMVTPRVVCMIINEAYHTAEEGTASRQDIDLAMKLGANYPFGPFEWCEKIGIHQVCRLMHAIYESTGNDRYKVCPLLEKEAVI